eukprot:CAMPEP_0194171836 /NCGR_PEP_ID=MMETSP0154-20130528/6396_1 /TAXON_ID=1049557 /ORGANISM="Thalassiothrix antarctica, Strain L6-D1" /LENGTH=495 /DNA_ID=CAMNT_0038884307 /DNA_START=370 /DNA_END=1857 /DNA_ORIENTATION=-
MGITSEILLDRIRTNLKLKKPTTVQASAYKTITDGGDVTIGAETGSGKTLAYLLPIIDSILSSSAEKEYDFARAIILVPNKELANQVIRMAIPLCGGEECVAGARNTKDDDEFTPAARKTTTNSEDTTDNKKKSNIVRLAIMPGGLYEPQDFPPFRQSVGLGGNQPPVDILVSTPAAIGPLGLKPKNIDMFADVDTLVIDEADMLLDGGYIQQLENVLMGFRRADRIDSTLQSKKTQHVFVAATLPNMGLKSVDAYLNKKFPSASKVTMAGMHNAKHYGLEESSTLWIEAEENKDRMEQLIQTLQTSVEENGLKGEKIMVFLNSAKEVDLAHGAIERAGFAAVRYHAKIPLKERTLYLDQFRNYDSDSATDKTVPIMVCTDLASRGLDIPGVTAVIQLQFAGNVVAHLHRMGRCGRAGNRNGRGLIFYDSKQKILTDVIREAENSQEEMMLKGNDVIDVALDEDSKANVKAAFSRKRGFTKKLKKVRRDNRDNQE